MWRRDVRVAAHPISACMVSNSAFSRAYSSLRSFDAIGGAIARGTAPKRVTGRPAATAQGRCLRSAHCPHCVFSPFFSRGDIDRRAFQRAPPPSATGVREAPPKVTVLLTSTYLQNRVQACNMDHGLKRTGHTLHLRDQENKQGKKRDMEAKASKHASKRSRGVCACACACVRCGGQQRATSLRVCN